MHGILEATMRSKGEAQIQGYIQVYFHHLPSCLPTLAHSNLPVYIVRTCCVCAGIEEEEIHANEIITVYACMVRRA